MRQPLLFGLIALGAAIGAKAQTLAVLHSFAGSPGDGVEPLSSLVRDAAGNLYGTTAGGGASGNGTVFELVMSSGSYTEKVLYSFVGGPSDGAIPEAGLIMDAAGNLYGTTYSGGSASYCLGGCGTVFELVNSSGTYTEKVLYSFSGPASDGAWPQAGLVTDAAGNLYGTTAFGGSSNCLIGCGTVFELVNSSGTYTERILHSFGAFSGDGNQPVGDLAIDAAGNLYGATDGVIEGADCYSTSGIVFELVKSAGSYTEKVLYSFPSTREYGAGPLAGLVMDAAGNLYGTTGWGGAYGAGTVFEMVNSSGSYTEKVLWSFGSTPDYASLPEGGLAVDASGNLYGTVYSGGSDGGGIVFELINSSGSYTEKVLHSFASFTGDGANPQADLIMDTTGNLYGTTLNGGANGYGIVFEFEPTAMAAEVLLSTTSLSFGGQVINTASAPQSVTVTNSGNANLAFGAGAVTLSGANANDFVVTMDTCSGMTFIPSGTCSVSVTFAPLAPGRASAALSLTDNALNSPQMVVLSGTAFSKAVVTLSPASLSFPGQTVDTTSVPQTVTLSNSGTGPLGIVSIATDNTRFAQTNNCPPSLGPGASCGIAVTFTPAFAGTDVGHLTVTDDAAGSPHAATLTGMGAGTSATGATLTVVYTFAGPTGDGGNPYGALLNDASGNLYGTTYSGGSSSSCSGGCGTVFELAKSSGSYTEKVLYAFTGANGDGAHPRAGLVVDTAGNLYGTTRDGGASDNGIVFELVNSSGSYTLKVLYSFTGSGGDGANPDGGVVVDASGNLFGTTGYGGSSSNCTGGCGTVFELANSSGSYTEEILHSFTGYPSDGHAPVANLIRDAAGNLYGTTLYGGVYGPGTVFELVNSGGSYAYNMLYSFGGFAGDAQTPHAGLIMDQSGKLYGTTLYGGSSSNCTYGCGTVFELTKSSSGYSEKVLYSFTGSGGDGYGLFGGLVVDAFGNLFGTTGYGGSSSNCTGGCGTVFELVNSSGSYTETLLYSFMGSGDGANPAASLVMDTSGKLYGTAYSGGSSFSCSGGCGTVFEVTQAPAPVVTLSPTSLSFSGQPVGTTSAAQEVTLTNSGNASLTFTAISTTGPFAITPSGTTCSTSNPVAASASCTVAVTFVPTAGGPASGVLSFTDNASGSPQIISLSATGQDFSLAVPTGSSSSATVSPGGTATYTVAATGIGGFNQGVSLSCSGAPSLAACQLSQTSVTPSSSGTNVTVTVTTTAPSVSAPRSRRLPPGRPLAPWPGSLVMFALLLACAARAVRSWVQPGASRVRTAFVGLALGILLTLVMAACGGGGEGGGGGTSNPGTPPGAYTITLTGSSGSGTSALSRSVKLTLTVT
jgi:uncharacterized repeat protein (TIGR03803 family)